jgi:hypothetical protein
MTFTVDTAPATSVASVTAELDTMAAVAVQAAVVGRIDQFQRGRFLSVQVPSVTVFLQDLLVEISHSADCSRLVLFLVTPWDILGFTLIRNIKPALKFRSPRLWDTSEIDKVDCDFLGEGLHVPPVEADFVNTGSTGRSVNIPFFRTKFPVPHIQASELSTIGVDECLVRKVSEILRKNGWVNTRNLEFHLIPLTLFLAAVHCITLQQVSDLVVPRIPNEAAAIWVGIIRPHCTGFILSRLIDVVVRFNTVTHWLIVGF